MQEYNNIGKEHTANSLVQLANLLIDDTTMSLKEKKAKLKVLQETHPEIYYVNFLFLPLVMCLITS